MSERVKIILDKNADILRLPAIALRGLVVFPGNIIHFEVGRKKSIAAIEWAMSNNNAVFLTAQQDMDVEDPGFKDLYAYGVVAEVKQVLRVSDELVKVLVEGKYRAKLLTLDSSGRFLLASTKAAALRGTKSVDSARVEALVRSVKEAFEEYLSLNPRLSKDVVYTIITNEDAALLCDYIPANLLLKYTDKQALLNEGTVSGRLEKLLEILRRETKILHIEKDIQSKVNEQMDKNQRDYYLREQLHVIREELGEDDDNDADSYRARIQALKLPKETEEKLLREVSRFARQQAGSAEAAVLRRAGLGGHAQPGGVPEIEAGGTLCADQFETPLYLAQRRARADRRGEGAAFEPLLDAVAAPQFAHQHGRDHFAAVGDGVVEGDHLDRSQPHAVAVAHLDQHDARIGNFPVGGDRRGALAQPFQSDGLSEM